MHILVTNDDGPPSETSSPYILPFVQALSSAGHTVSVIIPHTQRSWIGKAHLVGQDIVATHYHPPTTTPPGDHDPANPNRHSPKPDTSRDPNPWILVNSTPATCAQLGLGGAFFQAKAPIDLVVSGPNYGRNTTALFALSSGTLGAALEASVCGLPKVVALSFAFFTRERQDAVVAESCAHAVRVVEGLYAGDWCGEGKGGEGGGHGVEGRRVVFSVNVPVLEGVRGRPVRWTRMFENRWGRDACFREVSEEGGEVRGAEGEERAIREREEVGGGGEGGKSGVVGGGGMPRHFKWAPSFTDLAERAKAAGEDTDIAAVNRGETSVTAIRPAFEHVQGMQGELKL
ncbi:hypothetical protein MBLNU230_g0021t1 [Neophaeotheca triangularis]